MTRIRAGSRRRCGSARGSRPQEDHKHSKNCRKLKLAASDWRLPGCAHGRRKTGSLRQATGILQQLLALLTRREEDPRNTSGI